MPIEDAMDEVAENLQLVTYPIIQDTIMDTAPIMHDLDTGKLSKLLKRPKYLGLNDIVLDAHEARLNLDFLQDFEMGYASDGQGNITHIPNTVYENKLTFKEKYPRAYKGLAVAAFMLTLGLAAAISGCVSDTGQAEGKVIEKKYDVGKDGVNGTPDDGIIFKLSPDPSGGSYRIGTDCGENLTHLNKILKNDSGIWFEYNRKTEQPYKVTQVEKISENYDPFPSYPMIGAIALAVLGGIFALIFGRKDG